MGDRQGHSSLLANARVPLSARRRGSIDIGQDEDHVGFGNAALELLVAVVAHDRQALAIVIAKNIQSLIERRTRGDETLDDQSGTPDTVKPATISARFRLRQDRQKRNRRRIPCRATINPCRQSSSRTAIVSFFTATIIAPFMSMSVMVEAKRCSISRKLSSFVSLSD